MQELGSARSRPPGAREDFRGGEQMLCRPTRFLEFNIPPTTSLSVFFHAVHICMSMPHVPRRQSADERMMSRLHVLLQEEEEEEEASSRHHHRHQTNSCQCRRRTQPTFRENRMMGITPCAWLLRLFLTHHRHAGLGSALLLCSAYAYTLPATVMRFRNYEGQERIARS